MNDIQYIYSINKTTLPISKEVILDCINNAPVFGYIYCKYNQLISKIKEINLAPSISVTKNPEKIFTDINNPEETPEVIFKIEGQKLNNDPYIDTVIKNNDIDSWTDFTTYSKEMRTEILELKEKLFKKFLWNYENIHNWFLSGNIQLGNSMELQYAKDWNIFRNEVVDTEDLDSYIQACDDIAKENYKKFLIKNTKNLLKKHRVELMLHVDVADKNEETMTLNKPIINKIFLISNKYNQCRNEFPRLKVVGLSQRNFNMIGIIV